MPLQTAERLALQHQRDLATIAGATTSVVASVALGADPATISTWYFGVVDGLLARIQAGHAQARLSSTQFLQKHAAMNGVDLTPVPASLNMERARTSLRVTGPVAFQTAMRAGQDEEQAIRSMATQMAGSSQRLVMAGDRDTFEQTLNAGKGVIGWRRRLAGKSCGFCAMLASRGAVYETRKSATQAKDGLAFHDHCNCWAEPMYKHETEPPEVRLLQRQWRNVTAGKRGGGAARAWRQHWEENVSPVERERLGMAAAKAAPSPIPGPPVPTPGVVVRSALDSRKTLSGLEQAWQAEARRITGRDLDVVIPAGTSLQTAKEYAEGVLRGMERFPDSALLKIRFGQMPGDHYAEAGQRMIVFNERWSDIPNRPGLVAGTAHMVDDWPSRNIGWGVRGNGTTMSTAIHEFGHIIDTDTLGERIHARARAIVERQAAAEGIDVVDFVAREISVYATSDANELIAEAFADVMLRGQAASPVAREIFDLLEAEYFRAGGRITPSFGTFPAKAVPDVVDDFAKLVARHAGEKPTSVGPLGGHTTDAEVLTYSDGTRLVRKIYKQDVAHSLDAEVLGSEVARAAGVLAPRTFATPDGTVWMEFIEGRTGTSILGDTLRVPGGILDSAPGRRLGIADVLMDTGDRSNPGNWLRTANGDLVALDHGAAFYYDASVVSPGPFGRRYVTRDGAIKTGTISREDYAEIRARLDALRPEFLRRGRLDWFREASDRLDELAGPAAVRSVASAAPLNLAKMTVPQLRALAKERGVTLPPKALKADIVRALEEGPSAPTPRVVKARAGSTIGDVELGPTQGQVALGEADIPRRPTGDFSDRPFDGPEGAVVHRGETLPEGFESSLTAIRRGEFEVRPGLTEAESQALDRYVLSRVADPLNTALREGRTPPLGTVQVGRETVDLDQVLAQLDSAIAASELAADTILYRGALMRSADLRKLQPGAITREDGFLSTTTDRQNAYAIINWRKGKDPTGGRTPVTFEILAPKGTHGAVAHVDELEVLLGRGRRLRVVDILRPTRPGDVRKITLELLPEPRAIVATAVKPNLSKLKVADLRTMAAERQIPIPAKATKAELVRLVQSTPDEIKALQQKAIRDAAFARAKTGAEALRAAPAGLGRSITHLTEAQARAIQEYKGVFGYRRINRALRSGDTSPAAEEIEMLDEVMASSRLSDDVVVYRGVRNGRDVFGDRFSEDLTSAEFGDLAYVSTGTSVGQAENIARHGFGSATDPHNPVVMRIAAPRGTGAVEVTDTELLLDRGLKFRVLADRGVVDGMRRIDVEVVPRVLTETEQKAAAQRALRAAVRERNRLIESSTGTARLLAEVDELISKGASKATILQRLDVKLTAPDQVFAGADAEIVKALRTALDTGDAAKLRTALTRAGTKAKVKPISKAGAKVKFDPATMEAVAGEIADGAQVVVVTRGSTLTLPDGSTMQLTKAKVTAVPVKAPTRVEQYQARKRAVAEVASRDDLAARPLGNGAQATTTLETAPDGRTIVRKKFDRGSPSHTSAKQMADSEELGPLVLEALGIRGPAVVRVSNRTVAMEHIAGELGDEIVPYGSSVPRAILDSDDARLIGLADYLTYNTDRNTGNWIRMPNGRLAGIDQADMFLDSLDPYTPARVPWGLWGDFSGYLRGVDDAAGNPVLRAEVDISAADLALVRKRLTALRQEFVIRDRLIWYTQMLQLLRRLEGRAVGTRNMLVP